jgi:hypothetical protein
MKHDQMGYGVRDPRIEMLAIALVEPPPGDGAVVVGVGLEKPRWTGFSLDADEEPKVEASLVADHQPQVSAKVVLEVVGDPPVEALKLRCNLIGSGAAGLLLR